MMLFAIGFVAGWIGAIVAHPYILSWQASQLQGLPQDIDPDIWEEAEVITNATVQVMRNSRTGEFSIGWWRNK